MQAVSSWGRLSREGHRTAALVDRTRLAGELARLPAPGLAYGNGRSYGDVCLNPGGSLWMTRGLDRLIEFDEESGLLRCEAGVTLGEILAFAVPRGWFLPVSPGTQFTTLGGAIANDVHGKNHHRMGTFGRHVTRLRLHRSDGTLECGPEERADWFAATVGGLGLTGVVSEASLRLRRIESAWMDVETIPFETLDDFFALAQASEAEWAYTVAWVDCVNRGAVRGLFYRANHAAAAPQAAYRPRRLAMPFTPPFSLVNRASLKLFNLAYYRLGRRKAGRALQHYEPYFYPLDHVRHWNRMYGPRGFFQHQSVVPPADAARVTAAMLAAIAASGTGSFLAVLKTFGDVPSPGLLSFPMKGTTLALDFPNAGESTRRLLDRLDALVAEARGRIYPAKDARMSRALFESGYPSLRAFLPYRDPMISSSLSRRLMPERA